MKYSFHVLPLLLVLLSPSCSSSEPDRDHPFSVVLAYAPTQDSAQKLAEQLSKKYQQLRDLQAVTIRDSLGGVRHLVLSHGFDSPEDTKKFKKSLSSMTNARLKELDIRTVDIMDDEAVGSSPAEGCDDIERMAELLPNPVNDRLLAFSMVRTSHGKLNPPPKVPIITSAKKLSVFFRKGDFSQVGEAEYSSPDGTEKGIVFVGFSDKNDKNSKMMELKRTYNFLLQFKREETVSESQKEQAKDSQRGKKEKRKRRRKRRRKKRKKQRFHERKKKLASKAAGDIPLVPILKELPAALSLDISSKKLDVFEVKGIDFSRRNRSERAKPTLTAWLWNDPESKAIVVCLFTTSSIIKRLMRPCTLTDRVGLSFSSWTSAIWEVLPEVGLESESLEFIAVQGLNRWLAKPLRKSAWLRDALGIPVFSVGFSNKEKTAKRWQASWIKLASQLKAKQFFEKAMVAPRQGLIKRVLNARKNPGYDVGLTLHEIGDIQAWLFTGARRGRVQEVYFRRGREVWLISSGVLAHGGLDSDGLIGRTELLKIWDAPADKKAS